MSLQPTPTLFPYTTLFRSRGHGADHRIRVNTDERIVMEFEPQLAGIAAQDLFHQRMVNGADRTDRKSTRLNSSHTVISYAVFCLKKKKKIITVIKQK